MSSQVIDMLRGLRRAVALWSVLGLSVLAVVACGGDGAGGDPSREDPSPGEMGGASPLTIYSSLPRHGAQRAQSRAIDNGIRLALRQADNRAGRFRVRYEPLTNSTPEAQGWTAARVTDNARRAARDSRTGAYIGELESGASTVSMPILNEARVPQISASNTAVGLTAEETGAEPGEPERYYPVGERHYVRVVPRDTAQGTALATVVQQDGCERVFLADDGEVYGAGLARNVERALDQLGVELVGTARVDPDAANHRALARRAARQAADCFVFAGTAADGAARVFRDVAAALGPDARFYGSDGLAVPAFTDPDAGGLATAVAQRTKIVAPAADPQESVFERRRFLQAYEEQFGDAEPNPYALYGYEAARLALSAIERSQTGKRKDVIEALFNTSGRESVLGTYSIDENGDTTLKTYAVYGIRDGALEARGTIDADR